MSFQELQERLARMEAERSSWHCPEHDHSYGASHFACPGCERNVEQTRRAWAREIQRHRWWRDESGVPLRNRCATPDHLTTTTASARTLYQATARYVAEMKTRLCKGEGLVLLGPPGLGKTLALTAIVNRACQSLGRSSYAVWPEVLATVKCGFGAERNDPRREAAARLYDARLLALDELGMKTASEFDHAELFNLIDYRYRNRKPTLVAANSTLAEFAKAVGERVADRLQETGPVLVLQGQSFRGRCALEGDDAFPEPPSAITARVHRRGSWADEPIHRPDE